MARAFAANCRIRNVIKCGFLDDVPLETHGALVVEEMTDRQGTDAPACRSHEFGHPGEVHPGYRHPESVSHGNVQLQHFPPGQKLVPFRHFGYSVSCLLLRSSMRHSELQTQSLYTSEEETLDDKTICIPFDKGPGETAFTMTILR